MMKRIYQEICKLIKGDRKLVPLSSLTRPPSFIMTVKKHMLNYIAQGTENDVLDGIRGGDHFLNRGV